MRGRDALAGYVSIQLSIGLRITDLPVLRFGRDGPRVGLPRVPKVEPKYSWCNNANERAFSAAVLRVLLERHPDALDVRAGARDAAP